MHPRHDIERALDEVVTQATCSSKTPPRLRAAIEQAVFPGGRRIRPMLTLAVSEACGNAAPSLATRAAVAIELLHCASLAYDDLPCFDDAYTRRGRPSLHAEFGAPLAILAGNSLITMAFDTVARATGRDGRTKPELVAALAQGVGPAGGIAAGQAWEEEPTIDLATYHRAKTGSLFEAAAIVGAIAGGGDDSAWGAVGLAFGEAYQVADDVQDVLAGAEAPKTTHRDDLLDRPNAVLRLGVTGASARLRDLAVEAHRLIPPCPGRDLFTAWLSGLTDALSPEPRAALFADALL